MAILTPYLKSPFTDLTGQMVSSQWGSPCRELEMKAIDCMEAYGFERGKKKCSELLTDFHECIYKKKQELRVMAMRAERHRQHFAGERTKDDKYSKNPPAPDTF